MRLPGLGKLVAWRANRLVARGRQPSAIRLAETLARLRPVPESWTLLGELLIGARQYATAEEALRTALGKNPSNPEISYLLAMALIGQSRFEDATKVLREQRAATPDSFFPLLGLVDVHGEESDEKALATAKEAARLIPSRWPWAKYELAVKLLHISGGETLARQLLEEASVRLPRNESRYGLSHLLLAVLLEAADPPTSKSHLDAARRSWRSRVSFDEMLESTRRTIGGSNRAGP
jgi:tetratricopeptide (TPR) repeat protein